jgi:hypothetical protein
MGVAKALLCSRPLLTTPCPCAVPIIRLPGTPPSLSHNTPRSDCIADRQAMRYIVRLIRSWPHRSKCREIYGSDSGQKLYLLVRVFLTQAGTKNQEVMMAPFQGFLATCPERHYEDFRATFLRTNFQTAKLLFLRDHFPPDGLTVNFPLLAPGGPS